MGFQKKIFYAIWHLKQILVGYNITMHLHNDRSISDLLPWQTSDSNSPQINFIQTHLAAMAKMAPQKPETIIRTKPLSQQKRHRTITTINTTRKTNQETSNQSQSRVRVSTSSPPKDRSRNILNQSLHQNKLDKFMETTECSSPIRVTQISTEHQAIISSVKQLKDQCLRYPSEKRLENSIRKAKLGASQKATFSQFVEKRKNEDRNKRNCKNKNNPALCFQFESVIHVRPVQQKKMFLESQSHSKKAGIGESKTLDIRKVPRDRRRLISSTIASKKNRESQNISTFGEFPQNYKTLGLFYHS